MRCYRPSRPIGSTYRPPARAPARALVFKPDRLFLDEAVEAAIYGELKQRLPETSIVSIGHRPLLRQWHDRQVERLVEGSATTPA